MGAKKTQKNGSLTKTEYEMLSAYRYALRRFLRFSAEAAAAAGLTTHQHQALLAIRGFPGREHITNGELAEQLQIKHHSAVGLVNRLEALGLIARQRGASDRREVYVSLTRRGSALLERLSLVHQEELRHMAPRLSLMLDKLKEGK